MTSFAATSYTALAEQQIESANVKWKKRWKVSPERVHAMVFGVIETQSFAIFKMKEADIADLIFQEVKLDGWAGWMFNTAILSAILKVVIAALKWLDEQIDAWQADRKRTMGVAIVREVAMSAVWPELQPLFDAARAVLR